MVMGNKKQPIGTVVAVRVREKDAVGIVQEYIGFGAAHLVTVWQETGMDISVGARLEPATITELQAHIAALRAHLEVLEAAFHQQFVVDKTGV